MSNPIRAYWVRIRGWFLYKVMPSLVDYIVAASTAGAIPKLKAANARRVLVDSSVLYHGVTHEAGWVDCGDASWGGWTFRAGFQARIPVYADDDDSRVAQSVRYIPGIVSLAKRGHLKLATSSELRDEQLSHPVTRFAGVGPFAYSLFRGIEFELLREPQYSLIISSMPGVRSVEQQRRDRLSHYSDPLYKGLLSALGPKNSQDAWHITTAERHDCYCFLTMDFRLLDSLAAQANNHAVKSLKVKVLTPEQFGVRFSIPPISPRLFSYHEASVPVMHDQNWPESRRIGRKRNGPPAN